MMDSRSSTAQSDSDKREETIDCCISIQDKCELHCLKIARFCHIEDLALSAFVSEDNTLVNMEDISTLKLRKETIQLVKLTRCAAIYFVLLTFLYLFQTSCSYIYLSEESFQEYFSNEDYANEIYGLVDHVCLMNIVHSLTLMSLGFFVLMFTKKFKMLNERHYMQLGALAIAISIVYFLPILLVAYRAWSDATFSEKNAHKGAIRRFYDMLFYILLKSAMGLGGFLLTCIIHLQLYILVFVMMWCASHIKQISDKVKKLKEEQAGTYLGLELRGNNDEPGLNAGVSASLEKKKKGQAIAMQSDITLAEDQQQKETADEKTILIKEEEKQTKTGDLLDINNA